MVKRKISLERREQRKILLELLQEDGINDVALSIIRASAEYKGNRLYTKFRTYSTGDRLLVGGRFVTPFLVDHSAFNV